MSNSFSLKIADIRNAALQKLAWSCDKDNTTGYLSNEEFSIFKQKALYLEGVSDEDFNQAMGLYKSEESRQEAPAEQAVKQEEPAEETKPQEPAVEPEEQAVPEELQEEPAEEPDDKGKKQLVDLSEINFDLERGLEKMNTAAGELATLTAVDMMLLSSGTPYGPTYQALIDKRETYTKEGKDTSDINAEIGAIEEQIKEYVKTHKVEELDNLIKNGEMTIFRYGKNKEKKGVFTFSVNSSGNNAIQKNSSVEPNDDDENNNNTDIKNDNDDGDDNSDDNSPKNKLDGGVTCTATLDTEEFQGKVVADVRSDNTDIYLGAAYNKNFDSNRNLALSFSGRETIEPGYSTGSGGLSVDYKSQDFSAGAFGYIKHESMAEQGTQIEWKAEGYLKYKENVQIIAGYENEYIDSYPYAKVKLNGVKEYENTNLKLTGGLTAEVGKVNYNDKFFGNMPSDVNIDVRMRGGIQFETEDLNANVNALASYNCLVDNSAEDKKEKFLHNGSVTLLGSITKGKLGLTTMVSAFAGESTFGAAAESDCPVRISSSITIQCADVFKGISPFISYTLDNSTNGRQHNIGAGIKMSIEKLAH